MNIVEFAKGELSGWGKYERVLFPSEILLIIVISFLIGDSKVALVSAVCGISYTILAGKGKISCYIFGLTGTLCYSYIAFQNALYGNLFLYMFYYFPMQILGIFKWKKHLKRDTQEIVKTKLKPDERIIYTILAILFSIILSFVLKKTGDATPFIDAVTTVFSVLGLILTVKRCIEQWYVWFVVNVLSVFMWIEAYMNGSNCFATILMWATYVVLSVYFLFTWKKDLQSSQVKD
ncbi:nicotinamide mononucleotide transporter PnuC [Clostridium sp. CAG:967]|nr:nicotinamide mononucleotide transporter PnuC [Clostridium sp. CAG:967]